MQNIHIGDGKKIENCWDKTIPLHNFLRLLCTNQNKKLLKVVTVLVHLEPPIFVLQNELQFTYQITAINVKIEFSSHMPYPSWFLLGHNFNQENGMLVILLLCDPAKTNQYFRFCYR